MDKMRRALSMVIIFCMALGVFGTISFAEGEDVTIPEPIFVLDLSEYTGEFIYSGGAPKFNQTAKNAIEGTDIQVDVFQAVNNAVRDGSADKHTIDSQNGTSTDYIELKSFRPTVSVGSGWKAYNKNYILVSGEDLLVPTASVEFWVKVDDIESRPNPSNGAATYSRNVGAYFANFGPIDRDADGNGTYGFNEFNANSAKSQLFNYQGLNMKGIWSKTPNSTYYPAYGKWAHVVMIREAAVNDGVVDQNTVTTSMYINNQAVTNDGVTEVTMTDTSGKTWDAGAFSFGLPLNHINSNGTLDSRDMPPQKSISGLKIYDSKLTKDQVAKLYNESKGNYNNDIIVDFSVADGSALELGQNTITATYNCEVSEVDRAKLAIAATGGSECTPTYTWSTDNKSVDVKFNVEEGETYTLTYPVGKSIRTVTYYAEETIIPGTPPEDPNLLFDMKIEASGDDYEISDESGNYGWLADNYISHTASNVGTEYKPELATGNGTKNNYLIFGVDGQTDKSYKNRTLHVKFKDKKGIEFAEGNERTYEMWINFQKPQSTTTFISFGCDYSTDISHNYLCAANRIQTSTNGNTSWWVYANRERSTSATKDFDIENNVWNHLVITEKFTETNAETGAGTWTDKSYINGKLIATGTITNVPKAVFDDGDGTFTTSRGSGHKANTLSIGCSLSGTALNCSIADFKLYNDVRTSDEIMRDYIVSSKDFGVSDAKLSFRSIEVNNNDYFEADAVTVPGKAKVRAVLESYDIADRNYTLVAAVNGDVLHDFKILKDISLAAGETKYLEVDLNIPDKTEGTFIKLMLLDNLASITPICEAVTKVVDTKQITMPNVFSNNMILQRGTAVNIFGTAPTGSIATVQFGEFSAEGVAENGEFIVKLPSMPAEKTGKTLTVKVLDANRTELKTFTYDNVVVGDVFYGAGQSNMAMNIGAEDFGDLAERLSVVENARMFNVTQVKSVGARPSGDEEMWQIIDETNYTDGSATMYPTILKLRELNAIEPDVPIGFVKCAWGGTNLHHWVGTDLLQSWQDKSMYSKPYTDYLKETEYNKIRLTDLYYSMAQAVTPFTFKAAVWYQGEGETGNASYPTLAADMIKTMRRDFGYDIPYFVVQLPGYEVTPTNWGKFKLSQLTIPEKTEGDSEFVVVISDTGEANNIHPGDKDVVGERIARYMMKELYGNTEISWTGPIFESAQATGANVTISFKDGTINDGLCSLADDNSLDGFEVSADGTIWKAADAQINGETIVVSSDEVPNPTYVRFGIVAGVLKSAGSYKTETISGTTKTVKLPLVQFSEKIAN